MWEVALVVGVFWCMGYFNNRRRIKKLYEELLKIDIVPMETATIEKMTEADAIYLLETRVKEMQSCCQCPIYLNYIQKDKGQKFE